MVTEDCKPIELRGLYLDLNIELAGGDLVRFGPVIPENLIRAVRAMRQNQRIIRWRMGRRASISRSKSGGRPQCQRTAQL
jgi:hypothetical protein